MRKYCEENERMKRKYMAYLKDARGQDVKSRDKAAAAILKFEQSTKFKPFKKFHIDQAGKFKDFLEKSTNPNTGNPLTHSTVDATLRTVKGFFHWLAGQSGYKSRIGYPDVEYFNNNAKNARVAHADRDIPFPSLDAISHAFKAMPNTTEIERRDKALFAFLVLTAARVGAVASLRLKHIDLIECYVMQDGRDVNTKNSKTFKSWFLPVDPQYLECFDTWVNYLRSKKLFGPQDALFPKPESQLIDGKFNHETLSREPYSNGSKINEIVRGAFAAVHLPQYTPHSFRKTLTLHVIKQCKTEEQKMAFSNNMGHANLATTLTSYLRVSPQRQGELIRALGGNVE